MNVEAAVAMIEQGLDATRGGRADGGGAGAVRPRVGGQAPPRASRGRDPAGRGGPRGRRGARRGRGGGAGGGVVWSKALDAERRMLGEV